jgi:hypothetical protein
VGALIAVPMGRRTGVFAIDVDASPPHAHDGVSAWRALEAKHGVTRTRIHQTPSGGLHVFLRFPADRAVGCRIKDLPRGIECKGEGGAVIFPPSARKGEKYRVVSDVEPADAPSWLLDMVASIRGARPESERSSRTTYVTDDASPCGLNALESSCAALANAGPGERDRAVGANVLAIGSLAAGGELDPAHARDALTNAGRRNADAGADYRDKIERALETGMQSPRTAPEPGDFNDALRDRLRKSDDAWATP